jgi:hypothetical protein
MCQTSEDRFLGEIVLIKPKTPIYEVEQLHRYLHEKNVVFLWFHTLYLFSVMHCLYTVQVHPWAKAKSCGVCAA